MQKLFEFSYILSYEEEPRKLFINVTIGRMSDADGAAEHLFQVNMVYGTMDEGQRALPIAQICHAIVSDDHGAAGVGDDDGSTDLPLFLIYSQSSMNGKLEGVGDIQLITKMGDDVVDVTTLMGEVTSSLNLSHKAFMHNAHSLYEQLKAERSIDEFAQIASEAELCDVISAFMTFYVASLHVDSEQAAPFADFLERSEAYCHKDDSRVTMKVLD